MRSTRPSDDELFVRVARMMASRSLCDRDQVGAVIVDRQQRIVATGRNGPPAGFDHQEQTCSSWCLRAAHGDRYKESDYTDCPSLHAEINALLSSDRSRHEGGTIYVTSAPCFACAKAIANSGLDEVIVMTTDKDVERNAATTYRFLESFGVVVITMKGQDSGDGNGQEAEGTDHVA